jgi:hypothetical protein
VEIDKLVLQTTDLPSTNSKSNHDSLKCDLKNGGNDIFNVDNEQKNEINDEDLKSLTKYEGELLSISRSKEEENDVFKIKYFFMRLMGTTIYYYSANTDSIDAYFKTHYIVGCFVKENGSEKIGEKDYYSFTLKFPDFSKRQFFNENKDNIKTWITNLREATGYRNFFDFYNIDKTIGKGQFGLVKLGYNIQTNKRVAIKILEKNNIKTQEDWDLLKTEINILKLSTHPNIVKFYDHFENSDFIFLVMEYLNYGNLQEYLIKNNFNLGEHDVAIIAYQMADALSYLHSYGIIHRDFKPENIMLKQSGKEQDIDLKLMDFGLSKILGAKEQTVEGYGTMAFVAPEIILKKPYKNSVDVWSLGISIYYMLSGQIPFLSKDKKVSTAELIIKKPLLFSSNFKKYSEESIDILTKCLEKNPDKRIGIKEVLEHKWFKKYINPK